MSTIKVLLLFLTIELGYAFSPPPAPPPPPSPELNETAARVLYDGWRAKHGKPYIAIDDEKEKRFVVFRNNLQYIYEHNREADAGERTFRLGINRFADLTKEEYSAQLLGNHRSRRRRRWRRRRLAGDERYRFVVNEGEMVPEFVDWRQKGAVGHIKDQGSCGGGWAFSSTAAVEGINQIKTGNLIILSEQELLDCDKDYNEGCNGGLMDYAFEFIINNGGIDTEVDYPYEGINSQCDIKKINAHVVSIDDYVQVQSSKENVLKMAVANQPVSASIDISSRDFQFYESGVFSGECGVEVNHGVTIVGYGSENGKNYWIVRNSWGASWGEAGYIRMARNVYSQYGKCGIAIEASYPIKISPNPRNHGLAPVSSVTTLPVSGNFTRSRRAPIAASTFSGHGAL